MTETAPTFRAIAPVRLDFAGGWTDVPPYSIQAGGSVVSAAIRLYAAAEVVLGGNGMVLEATDLAEAVALTHPSQLTGHGPLPLHRAALRMFPVGPCILRTNSDVPAGSGLGSSGALDVALVSVLAQARGERLKPDQLAEYGWQLEAVEAEFPGGRQDQCSAAHGGFNRFDFDGSSVAVHPLELEDAMVQELERRIVLCYTGRSRVSGDTIARVMGAYERAEAGVVRALAGLRETAMAMADALQSGNLTLVGALVGKNWEHQQALDPAMTTPEMSRLEHAMRAAGALGGKAAGAGAGGCMFFVMGPDADLEAAQRVADANSARVLPCTWALDGVVSC